METDHVRTNRGIFDQADHRTFCEGRLALWEPFDYQAVEISLGEATEDQPEDDAAAHLAAVLREIWNPPGDLRRAKKNFHTHAARALRETPTSRGAEAFKKLVAYCQAKRRAAPWRRFVCICATVFPDMLAAKNGPTLARELGMTKANFSKQSVNFRKAFGWHFHPWRSEVGRENMRQARLAQREPGSATAYSRKGKGPHHKHPPASFGRAIRQLARSLSSQPAEKPGFDPGAPGRTSRKTAKFCRFGV